MPDPRPCATTTTSHQTVRLSAGSHRDPEDGVCVMELASMLAGEPFTDRPASVCPVIGSLLRAYNDHVGEPRRQQLYPYASLVVGTRDDEGVEWVRAVRCLEWATRRRAEQPWWRRLAPQLPDRAKDPRIAYLRRIDPLLRRPDDRRHEQVLQLVEDLAEIRSGGSGSRPSVPRRPIAPVGVG